MPTELTLEQKNIVQCTYKFIEVKAGPGTGKTFTLLAKIKQLQEERILLPTEKILFFTYTNALTSSNLQSLSSDKKVDVSSVKASTLDGFLIQFLCGLNISPGDRKALQNFEGSYKLARKVSLRLLEEHPLEIKTRIDLLAKRYPYILIDEIQDIKNIDIVKEGGYEVQCDSPKYKLLALLKHSPYLKQLIIVGDDKQSLYSSGTLQRFNFVPEVFSSYALTLSHRNTEFTGKDIQQTINTVSASPNTHMFSISEALESIQSNQSSSILILIWTFKHLDRMHTDHFMQLPSLWSGGESEGQKVLPQAFIKSLYWSQKRHAPRAEQTIENFLLPFKSSIKNEFSFTQFKCNYFQKLIDPMQTFATLHQYVYNLLKDSPKRNEFKLFYDFHEHLHNEPLSAFTQKITISTIHSAKGLEADDTYLLFKNSPPAGNLGYVAHTRHKKSFSK